MEKLLEEGKREEGPVRMIQIEVTVASTRVGNSGDGKLYMDSFGGLLNWIFGLKWKESKMTTKSLAPYKGKQLILLQWNTNNFW